MTKAAKKTNRQIERRTVDSLTAYGRDARTHSDEQIGQIMASLGEFGWTNPVLIDEKNNIIAGHARVEAARRLGIAEVPCIVLDGLTEAQKRAYLIADNKLALNAG
jgi:ParB-like chromosome segregation protein Spo0J